MSTEDIIMKTLLRIITLAVLLAGSSMAMAGVVNINTANAQSLSDNITGVGQKRAQAIIDYRKAHGPFKSVDDLSRVKGIGSKLVNKNRKNLMVSEKSAKTH